MFGKLEPLVQGMSDGSKIEPRTSVQPSDCRLDGQLCSPIPFHILHAPNHFPSEPRGSGVPGDRSTLQGLTPFYKGA